MNKEQLLLLAKRTITERRQNAVDECQKILDELNSHDDWRSCDKALKTAQVQVHLYKNEGAKKAIAEKKAEQAKLLKKYGLKESDLRPNYFCKSCEDTGFVDGKTCKCLQEELRKLLFSKSNVQNSGCTFENSKETNKHNLAVYKKAKEVCDNAMFKNILLTGGVGTGKTYLLSACAEKCTRIGKSVLFVTALELSSILLECHLSDLATKQTIFDNLIDVDVLIVDDLGTETVYRNITAEYLFALLNERMILGKQTFLSTNLSLADIREKYDERIFSRLVDQTVTFVAKMEGKDKRIFKNN